MGPASRFLLEREGSVNQCEVLVILTVWAIETGRGPSRKCSPDENENEGVIVHQAPPVGQAETKETGTCFP